MYIYISIVDIRMYVYTHAHTLSGPDRHNKGWVGYCACVVEACLATQHWSGKL